MAELADRAPNDSMEIEDQHVTMNVGIFTGDKTKGFAYNACNMTCQSSIAMTNADAGGWGTYDSVGRVVGGRASYIMRSRCTTSWLSATYAPSRMTCSNSTNLVGSRHEHSEFQDQFQLSNPWSYLIVKANRLSTNLSTNWDPTCSEPQGLCAVVVESLHHPLRTCMYLPFGTMC